MFELYKKELRHYFDNPVGYIIVALFSLFANFLFIKDIFVVGIASMRGFFEMLPWLLMVFIPAITMRILAEEKRANTIEVLLTLPLSEVQIVAAKFLSLLTVVVSGLVLTAGLPISFSFLTKLYAPEIIVSYLGTILMGASFVSLSMFFSSQTKNQVVAFLSSALAIFFLLVLSSDFVATVVPPTLQDFLLYLSPLYHVTNFIKGLVDLRSTIYFAGLTVLFLFLTVVELEKRS